MKLVKAEAVYASYIDAAGDNVVRGLLAAFILAAAAVSAISPVRALRFADREERRSPIMLQRVVFAFAFTACLLVCGITLAAGYGAACSGCRPPSSSPSP